MNLLNFIIPDFLNIDQCSYLLGIFRNHKEIFKENINILGFTGMFPGCNWNKKDKAFDMYKRLYNKENLRKLSDRYLSLNIPLFICFDNENIELSDLDDEYSNDIMKSFNNKNNYVICYSKKLIEYIKENYKEINIVEINNRNPEYSYSILNVNHNASQTLFMSPFKEKFILRCDCDFIANRRWMFKHTNKDSVLFNINPKKDKYYTSKNNMNFMEVKKDPNYLDYEKLKEYSKKGINAFLLSGYGVYNFAMIENIIDYIYKDEFKSDARKDIYPMLINYKEQEEYAIHSYLL